MNHTRRVLSFTSFSSLDELLLVASDRSSGEVNEHRWIAQIQLRHLLNTVMVLNSSLVGWAYLRLSTSCCTWHLESLPTLGPSWQAHLHSPWEHRAVHSDWSEQSLRTTTSTAIFLVGCLSWRWTASRIPWWWTYSTDTPRRTSTIGPIFRINHHNYLHQTLPLQVHLRLAASLKRKGSSLRGWLVVHLISHLE